MGPKPAREANNLTFGAQRQGCTSQSFHADAGLVPRSAYSIQGRRLRPNTVCAPFCVTTKSGRPSPSSPQRPGRIETSPRSRLLRQEIHTRCPEEGEKIGYILMT